MKKYLLFLVLPLLAMACNKQPLFVEEVAESAVQMSKSITRGEGINLTSEEAKRLILLEDNYTRSKVDVLTMANGLKDKMKGESTTQFLRSNAQTPVLTKVIDVPVSTVLRGRLRGETPKIYVVQYGVNEGFALLNNDRRAKETVIMYADQGSAEDIPFDKIGFQYVMDIFKGYVMTEVEEVEAMRGDSIHMALAERFDVVLNDDPVTATFDIQEKASGRNLTITTIEIKELLEEPQIITFAIDPSNRDFTGPYWTIPKMTAKWGQGAPFNKYAPNGFAGCNGVAMGMALHHLYKQYAANNASTVPGVTPVIAAKYMWTSFPDYFTYFSLGQEESVGRLMQDLNNSSNLAATYFFDGNGTGAPFGNCYRTFSNFGTQLYTDAGPRSFDANWLYRQNGGVCIMGGKQAGTQYGHTWVVDSMSNATGTKFAHCNWGYNGSGNAMCNVNLFVRGNIQYTQSLQLLRIGTFLRRR